MTLPEHLRQPLLGWYDRQRRDLPWRATRDPYAIWISEVMSQQTRVETVVPYFERWLARFPDVEALAAATEDQVFELWQGLGYYSRARNLLRAARSLRDRHGGVLPLSAAELRSLPGVGRYTAGAIASIAYGHREPVVDGNVMRVLARLFAIEDDIRSAATQARFWELASDLVPPDRPGDFNQALMELGAIVCTPRTPRCGQCPIAHRCAGRARAELLPVKSPKPQPRAESRFAFAVTNARGQLLVARNPAGGLLGGMWQYPMAPEAGDAADVFDALSGLRAHSLDEHEPVTHVFSHIRMKVIPVSLRLRRAPAQAPRLTGYAESAWMRPDELAAAARSTLVRKLASRFAPAPGGESS